MPVARAQPRCRSSALPRLPTTATSTWSFCSSRRERAPSWMTSTTWKRSLHHERGIMRSAAIQRDTKETRIAGALKIEGRGKYEISTGIRFFDHMLELFTKHGGFDLKLRAAGDLDVDQHHTVEDVGIVLGQLFAKALGDRRGINRAGYFVLPMDKTMA